MADHRGIGPPVPGSPRGDRGDLLPRALGGRGRRSALRPAGHDQVAHLLRAACAAVRAGGTGMGRLSAGCDSLERLSLGAYVLGALDPMERARFEEHLESCRACREELVQMAGLPGLLSRVSLEDALDPPSAAPSPVRRRRFAAIGSVAAAAAVAAALFLALVTGGNSDSPNRPQTVAATNQRTGVSAKMAVRPVP